MKLKKEIILKRNNNFYLDKESYQVLSMLYKPLISSESLNIYLSLYDASFKKTKITSLFLIDIISSDIIESKLELKLETLKEYRLIKLEEDSIELYKPYNLEQFKSNNLLNLLKNITSIEQYNYLINQTYKEEPILNNVDINKIQSKLKYIEPAKTSVLYSFLELKEIVSDIKNLDDLKELIDSISITYNYTLEDILKIIYETETDNIILKDKFIENAYKRYEFKKSLNKNIKPKEEDIDIIKYFKEYNPEKALAYGGRRISDADKKTLERLRNETNLSDELISLLVIYSLVTNNYKMHAFRFYEVISNDWMQKQIETLDEAYHYINTLYLDNNSNKKKKNESSEDWFNDMWKSIKEEQNDK